LAISKAKKVVGRAKGTKALSPSMFILAYIVLKKIFYKNPIAPPHHTKFLDKPLPNRSYRLIFNYYVDVIVVFKILYLD